jgi:pimeloyl-ACP methyl ester carboxylesterase
MSQAMRLWKRIPVPILKSMYRRQFSRSYREIGPPHERELIDYMEEVVSRRMSRESIVNTFLRVVELDEKWASQPNTPFAGPMLLLFGADDSATPPQERERLHALYPQAEMTVFEDSGHATAITHADAYFARINEFLD